MSTRRIRVAHVLETIHMGGVEQCLRLRLQHLPNDRYEHLVICTQASGVIPDDIRALGVRIVETGVFRRRIDARPIRRAYQAVHAFKPDIVHAAVFEGIIMGVIAAKLASVKVVISEETSDAFGRRWTGNALAKLLYGWSDRVIAVSQFVHRYLVNDLCLSPLKAQLIPNAVRSTAEVADAEGFQMRTALGYGPTDVVFLFVGRLQDAHKGVSDALRAVAECGDSNVRLLVVGDGPDRATLEHLAAKAGLSDRVTFVGYVGDPRPMLGAANVLIHPARFEAFGLSLAEAMFANLPVVATNTGGIPYVVADGETGLLVAPGDISSLVSAIDRLAGDSNLRRAMGQAGRARAEAEFGVQKYIERIVSLYQEALKGD